MPEPTNHFATGGKLDGRSGYTHELLMELSDEELEEHRLYLRNEIKRIEAEPPDGKPYGNQYAAFKQRQHLSAVWVEKNRRGHLP